MYCPICGGAVARRELTYCNHCGSKLVTANAGPVQRSRDQYPESLIWAIVGGALGGLGCIIGLMAVMKNVVHFEMPWIVAFSIVSFALVVAAETVLISQLLSHQKRHRRSESLIEPATRELERVEPRGLPDPAVSVTEHTTRAFEPLLRRR